MNPDNRNKLAGRVTRAAEAALKARDHVTAIDILVGVGWLDVGSVDLWRQGRIDYLERPIQANLSRVSEAMKLFRSWAAARGLTPSETHYVMRRPSRPALRFSKSGNPDVEKQYRTHWVSPALSERKREKLEEKANRPPELVVISPLHADWTCHACGGTEGGLLMMEEAGPACLKCAGLGELKFLPSGDAKLTRRATAYSTTRAVVVRFSKTRGRYERQGLLVDADALAKAERAAPDANGKAGRPNNSAR